MQQRSLSYLDGLKNKVSKILTFTVIIYGVCIMFLYQYYQDKVKMEKVQILQAYYNKIIKISTDTIHSLTNQLSRDLQSQNIAINTNAGDIEICGDKCINYSLVHFGALIDQYIPQFVYYKIELNKKFLYSNTKVQNYQIEKIYHFNDYNQFNVSIAIDKLYWNKTKSEIKKPFWITTWFTLASILLLYIVSKILFKSVGKVYELGYQNKYKKELDQIQLNFDEELRNCKTSLMNKIWNMDFNKQKDLEINRLFSQEANQIAFLNERERLDDQESMIKDYKLKYSGEKVPCSIVLYEDNNVEEINVSKLIDLFTDRFDQEEENISILISSDKKTIVFASEAALYQIIYSIIHHLLFLLKKQSSIVKYKIVLLIDNKEQGVQLYFEYDGFPIEKQEELLKMSNQFFKTHANPFLLSLEQIFNILKNNEFEYKVYHTRSNIIEISKKRKSNKKKTIKTKNNVISLFAYAEENK